MLTLYVKTGCPFCHKVLPLFNALEGVEKEVKNIAEEGVAQELVEKGGKQQVPFLDDTKTGTQMYESDDIASYLTKEYGAGGTDQNDDTDASSPEKQGGVCPA